MIKYFPVYSFGLTDTDLNAFFHKPSSLKRTINPKESSAFYFVTLFNRGVDGTLRTGQPKR